MLLTEGIVLGHHISCISIKIYPTKIAVITNIAMSKNQKYVRGFLGHAGFFIRFIENFTKIVAPMFKFVTKDVYFSWDSHCQTTFETLKEKLSVAPVFRGLNLCLPFHIFIDSSNIYLGET